MSQPEKDGYEPTKLGCFLTCIISGLIIMIAAKIVATDPDHFGKVGAFEWLLFILPVFFITSRVIEYLLRKIREFLIVFLGRDKP